LQSAKLFFLAFGSNQQIPKIWVDHRRNHGKKQLFRGRVQNKSKSRVTLTIAARRVVAAFFCNDDEGFFYPSSKKAKNVEEEKN
jgi:hypothetical protein